MQDACDEFWLGVARSEPTVLEDRMLEDSIKDIGGSKAQGLETQTWRLEGLEDSNGLEAEGLKA